VTGSDSPVAPGFLAILLGLAVTVGVQAGSSVTVATGSEQLRGSIENGLSVFRGVPFAAAPVGDLRWRAPQPLAARSGVSSAQRFAPACMQTRYTTRWYEDIIRGFDGPVSDAARPAGVSEDCLYLNIWTSDVSPPADMPVMVFVYGGNNLGGWSYEPNYLGHNLARQGVVVVSIAYRLSVFGFYAHPELTAESGTGSSGNYGLLDQIAALEWVRDNIAAFGGDRDNVTVFGESAGGGNIGHLMLSPLARGLFKNAIRQSGSFIVNYRDTLEREEVFGQEFAAGVSAKSVEELRQLPGETLLQAAQSFYRDSTDNLEKRHFYGNVDGYVLPDTAQALYRDGRTPPVNLLLGANGDEKLMYTPRDITREQLDAHIDTFFRPGSADQVHKLLKPLSSNRAKLASLRAAQVHVCTAQLEAEVYSSQGRGETFLYSFSRVRPGEGGRQLGAYHGAELPYVFDTHDAWISGDQVDKELTSTIMRYWVNFARSGNPNGAGLPPWPRFNTNSRLAMELGDEVGAVPAPQRELCQLLGPPKTS
jgi:para-nitrobenzyl esterase